METVALRCNHCGAPLEVGPATRFVTCQFCHSQLAVKQTGSAAYTEVIEQIAATTSQMAGNLKVIELQNELERLDREWTDHRETFYVSGKNGHRSPPSPAGAVIGAVIGIPFLIFWISTATSMGAPAVFPIFGLVVAGFIAYQLFSNFQKAQGMESAKAEYQAQRDRLLRQIADARQGQA
ncbi:hypothetical protein [Verrucomicrobium spinosum]|uniref:hypothetical protein n=1 Tax=Verrucomicrobium spinosum TaxID=2736 RepID=UPI0001745858|nr:hypothetical protein [Verrucomicrobium spinosum]